MSSRPWVRIPPALSRIGPPTGGLRGAVPAFHLFPRGRSSDEQSARLSGEKPPVRVRSSPLLRGGRGVDGSTRGRDPRWRRFEPGRPPLTRADAEHRRAQQAVTLSPRAVVVRLHPSAPRGCSSTGRAPRLQRGRCRFDSDRLHLRLRSVNGKHAPFVRPRCGFDSCRRLLRTPVAQRRERCPATAEVAGSSPAGRTTRGRSSEGRAPGRHLGEARSIRVVRFTGPWCNGSTASSNLVSPGSRPGGPAPTTRSSRAGAVGLSGESGCTLVRRCGSTPRPTAAHDRDVSSAAGRSGSDYRLLIDRSRVRVPPGAFRAPVAQLAEQFRAAQP
jgi:hypothetical protein